MNITRLTLEQKLQALSDKFYCGGIPWEPKVGDYYTSSRNDLELYKIVDEDDKYFYTVYCTNIEGHREKWIKEDFHTKGFGLNRVHVNTWVLGK